MLNGREIFLQDNFVATDDAAAGDADEYQRDDDDEARINDMFEQVRSTHRRAEQPHHQQVWVLTDTWQSCYGLASGRAATLAASSSSAYCLPQYSCCHGHINAKLGMQCAKLACAAGTLLCWSCECPTHCRSIWASASDTTCVLQQARKAQEAARQVTEATSGQQQAAAAGSSSSDATANGGATSSAAAAGRTTLQLNEADHAALFEGDDDDEILDDDDGDDDLDAEELEQLEKQLQGTAVAH